MIPYANQNLFLQDSVEKQLNISYDGGVITNAELMSEDFALTEKLTTKGTIVLGDCNSAYIEFSVGYGTEPLEGKVLTVSTTPQGGNSFQIGVYKVVSDKPTADRRWRKITAYDALYEAINKDVTEWYDTILPAPEEGEEPTSVTLKQFRDSFFSEVGITQETVTLPNDSVSITRQADYTEITGLDVLASICELNGCMGRINRSGNFVYQFLHCPSEAIYPAYNLFPSHNLFPRYDGNPTDVGVDGKYISAKYEDFTTTEIGSIQIRNDKNDVGVTVGDGLAYVIEGNFLAYGLTQEVLTEIANNILDKVAGVYYCPSEIQAKGNPCLELGDPIVLHTRDAVIETIIMQRKLKGIQSLIDTYVSKGTKDTQKNLNSTRHKLVQTNGKVNEVLEVQKVIAETIEADEARIGYIESNYVQTSVLEANYATITELETVDGKIDNLTSIAITSQNISTVELNASQITAGTIDTARLDVASIAAQTVTVTTITGALVSPTQGTITIGAVRSASFQYYNGSSYDSLSIQTITINGTTYHLLGY